MSSDSHRSAFGEFSTVTGLSVKTLRFYHETGILILSSADDATGHLFYDASKIEKARVIMAIFPRSRRSGSRAGFER